MVLERTPYVQHLFEPKSIHKMNTRLLPITNPYSFSQHLIRAGI